MKKSILITLLIIIASLLSTCAPNNTANSGKISLIDGLDKQVNLDQPA